MVLLPRTRVDRSAESKVTISKLPDPRLRVQRLVQVSRYRDGSGYFSSCELASQIFLVLLYLDAMTRIIAHLFSCTLSEHADAQ